jgi:hypothetical protein
MERKEYNGWTNYETWLVNLWMDNDEGSYRYWRSTTQEVYEEAEEEGTFTRREQAILDLSDRLREEHEEALPEVEGYASDLLNAAMSEVNWYEIAEHLIDDEIEEDGEAEQVEEETESKI